MPVVDPRQQVPDISDGPLEHIHLWTETMVGYHDDPVPGEAVVDLGHGDHARVAEHEDAAVDVDYCEIL